MLLHQVLKTLLFERADGERWLEQALVVPLLPDTSEPEHLARSEYEVEWMPGRREMASAKVTLNRKDGTTFLYATHDPELIRLADRVVRMRDGRIEDPGASS